MREKKEINIQIGERVKAAREARELTQEQLAEQLDVTPQYISDLERGVVGISIPTLKNLCLSLNVTSDSILFSVPSEFPLTALFEKCGTLPSEQLCRLAEIVRIFDDAIKSERRDDSSSNPQ